MAKKWLEIAARSQNLDVSKVERAECLGQIAGYYSKIGVNSKSGDTSISYTDYWNDLVLLLEDNLAEKDNATTALIMYQEMAYQIYTNGIQFRGEGIAKEEIEAQLTRIEEQMGSDAITLERKSNERIQKLYDQLAEYVKLAYENMDAM